MHNIVNLDSVIDEFIYDVTYFDTASADRCWLEVLCTIISRPLFLYCLNF